MTVDEVLAFLDKLSDEPLNHRGAKKVDTRKPNDTLKNYPLKQKYLEYVTENPKSSEHHFTELGRILIQNCVDIHNSLSYGVRDKDKLKEARRELYKYLESKSQYK